MNPKQLFQAIESGESGASRAALDEDPALARTRRDDGGTLLHAAVFHGRPDLVEPLLDAGTAILGDLERLQSCLEAGPELSNDRSTHLSPLGWASFGNRTETARELIDRGARMDSGELLIEQGVDPNQRSEDDNDEGATALHAAAAMRYTHDSSRFIRMLLARGADRDLRTLKSGLTAADIAERARGKQQEAAPANPKNYHAVLKSLRASG